MLKIVRPVNNVAPLRRYARFRRRGGHFPEILKIPQKRQHQKLVPLCGDMLTFSGALKTNNSPNSETCARGPQGPQNGNQRPPSSPSGGLWPQMLPFCIKSYLKSINFDSQCPPAQIAQIAVMTSWQTAPTGPDPLRHLLGPSAPEIDVWSHHITACHIISHHISQGSETFPQTFVTESLAFGFVLNQVSRKPSGRRVPVLSALLQALMRNTVWGVSSVFLRTSRAIRSKFPEIAFSCRRNAHFRKMGHRVGFVGRPIRCSPLARSRFLGCRFSAFF